MKISKKHDFFDPAQQHTLTEQECELISFFRFFNKTQRDALYKVVFTMAVNDKKTTPKKDKDKS